MNKSLVKIIVVITIFSAAAASVLGSIALLRSTDYLTSEIEGKILSTAQSYAHDFSARFNHMEGLTDSLAAYVSTSFDPEVYTGLPGKYLKDYKKQLGKVIRETLTTTSTGHSLYVTFNPALTSETDEVWFAFVNGRLTEVSADFTNNRRDFRLPYKPDMAYFFRPQGKDCGIWTGPYYDRDIKEQVFSYSRAIYAGGLFIGVAGADITAEETVETVSRMTLYDSGYSLLLDEQLNQIVPPAENSKSGENGLPMNLQTKLADRKDQDSGTFSCSLAGEKHILGFSHLDNGWVFLTVQPESEAFSPIRSLKSVMIFLMIILSLVLAAFLFMFSRPFIKKQHALEEENRKKEIMLIDQSRQAKMGEMMANITHQWKQPLNTINLILANLQDSYHYGDLDDARLQKSVSKVEHIIGKMSDTITDFSDFLKPSHEKKYFDVNGCVSSALSLMEESINYDKIHVETILPEEIICFGYPNELTHVIFNALCNARDSIRSSCPAERSLVIRAFFSGGNLEITIFNAGDSILPESMPHIFEPYFTTKAQTGGTGLGLYISRQIIAERMHGHMFFENVSGGVCCHIEIPLAEDREGHSNE